MAAHILLIDPFPARRRRIRQTLVGGGYRVVDVPTVEDAFESALTALPILVIGDISIKEPQAMCRLRERHGIPLVLVGSGRSAEDEIVALNIGADDVITRPDNEELFLARISALLRRTERKVEEEEEGDPIVLGDMIVDPAGRQVTIDGRGVELSPREFLLLYTLAREAGVVVPRDELLEKIWGPNFEGEIQTIYVYISWLRKKLERSAAEGHRIVTVHGVGYKLVTSEAD